MWAISIVTGTRYLCFRLVLDKTIRLVESLLDQVRCREPSAWLRCHLPWHTFVSESTTAKLMGIEVCTGKASPVPTYAQ